MIPFTENYICEEYSLLAWSAPEESEYRGIDALPDWNHRDERQPASTYYDIMQFTGLRDKQGKEIYEGDILIGGYRVNSRDKYNVEWIEEYSGFGPFCLYNEDTLDYFLTAECEIIGNIYESDIETLAKGK